ncbi:hypothetical protein F5X96DRAFT_668798 [Biscogniauxia mediterranea]|nr:hypothetical protein F5X96DRAFT_668798 [Biscogniauxia mediterranea]
MDTTPDGGGSETTDPSPDPDPDPDPAPAPEQSTEGPVTVPSKRPASPLEREPKAQNDAGPSSRQCAIPSEPTQPSSGSLERLRDYRTFRYPHSDFNSTMVARISTNPRRVSGNVLDGKILGVEERFEMNRPRD